MASNALKKSQLWVDLDAVSDITGIEVSTLLEWQKFFYPFLAPELVRGESRYTKDDINVVFSIKRLIHEGGFRKEGAKRALSWNFKRSA